MSGVFPNRNVQGLFLVQSFPAQNAAVPASPFTNFPYNYDVNFGVQFDYQAQIGFGTPGVGPQHTFQSIQLPTSTVDYRQIGNIVEFVAEATYNRTSTLTSETNLLPLFTSPAPPGGVSGANEEVRIRPLIPLPQSVTTQLNPTVTSYRSLPPPIRSHTPPFFRNVEMLNMDNQNVLPPINGFFLGARLLFDGYIALVIINTTTAQNSPESPGVLTRGLLVNDLAAITNATAGDVVKIIVRGSYISDIP